MLFKKLDTHEMGGGFSVPKDVPFPLVSNHFLLYGKHTQETYWGGLITPPPWQVPKKFQVLGQIKILGCAPLCLRLLKISLCQKEGNAVMVAGFLHYLTTSICFPFIQGVRGKRSLPHGFPMLLERCDSFSPVLNLNQDVSQEASLVC